MENYFEVLKLPIDEIQGKDEATIETLVGNKHLPLYKRALLDHRPGAEERRDLLNEAKNTLIDPHSRKKHIAALDEFRRSRFINFINTLKTVLPTITAEQPQWTSPARTR